MYVDYDLGLIRVDLIKKDDIKLVLGKTIRTTALDKIYYFYGIPDFDLKVSDFKRKHDLTGQGLIFKREAGIEMVMFDKIFFHLSVGLLYGDIIEIALEDKEQIYLKKDRSVIDRALIGGLIAGGVGAIIGGMTGLSPKTEKAEMPDLLLSIRYYVQNNPALELNRITEQGKPVPFVRKK